MLSNINRFSLSKLKQTKNMIGLKPAVLWSWATPTRKHGSGNLPLFAVMVVIPWLLTVVYLGFIKTPEYESTASLLLSQNEASKPLNGLKNFFNKKVALDPHSDAASIILAQHYIHSADLLADLDRMIQLKRHYQGANIDFLSRLKQRPSQTAWLDFFTNKVKVSLDVTTHELVISVRAFTPEMAQETLNLIVKKAFLFFERVNNANLTEQSQLVQERLDIAKAKLIQMKLAYNQIAKAKEHQNLATLNQLEMAKLNLKFAETEYKVAQQAYVLWNMSTKKNTLIEIAKPNLPEYYDYPKLPYDFGSVLAVLFVCYLLVKMLFMIADEHID